MKTKKLSRWLSVLLVLGMVVGMLPTAWAGGDFSVSIAGNTSYDEGSSLNLTANVSNAPSDNLTYKWELSETSGSFQITGDSTKNTTISGGNAGETAKVSVTVTATPTSTLNDDDTGSGETAGNNVCTAFLTITVHPKDVPVRSISLSESSLELKKGGERVLTATFNPTNATNQSVTWSSKNESIATVDSGTVTAVAAGDTVITATSADGGQSAACNIKVTDIVTPSIRFDTKNVSLKVGGPEQTLTVTKTPSDSVVTFTSSIPSAVSIVDEHGGKIKPLAAASGVTITAKITVDGQEYSDTCTVNVSAADITVSSITVTPKTVSVVAGKTVDLSATVSVTPDTSANKAVTWSVTSGGTYASVDSNGRVTGKAAGTAIITATSNTDRTKTATCTVTVNPATVPTISTTSITNLVVNKSAALAVSNLPAGATVSWTSGNSNIVKLSAATGSSVNVTGVSVGGPVAVTATVKQGSTTIATLTCNVTVVRATLSNVTYSTAADRAVNLTDSAFNNVCYNYTGYNLDHVSFDSNSSSGYGSLVTDYVNSGDYGPKIATGRNTAYYTGSSNSKRLSNITFVPDGSKSGDVTFGYRAYYYDSSRNLQYYDGTLVITISGPSGDINYKTGKNETVSFDAEDFYDVCGKVLDGKLDYVRFGSYSLSKGDLYYKYDDSGEKKVSTSTNYYYGDSPYLDDITFVPDKNATGTTSVRFTAYSTKGRSFTGTVEISISSSGDSDIVYKVDENETVELKNSDFTSYCKDATGSSTIEWIKFAQPSSSKGTLYYKYDTSKQEEVSKRDEYYTNSTPKLSDITFVPDKNFTGTVTIDFNGEAGNGKSFSGSFKVKVGSASETGDVNYTATAGSDVNFNVNDFNAYCKEETGYNLDYLKFSSLPSSSTGVLYYDYSSSSGSNTKVSTSTQYKRGSSPYLDKVTFVPSKSSTGTVEIRFTGKSTGGDSFSGTVNITYTAARNAGPIYYTVGAGALNFKASDFEAACASRGTATLNSVEFSLPSSSAGVLYYNYSSAGNYDSLVMPGVTYGARSGNRLLSYVSFVPAPGFVGTVTLNYTGTDSQNATFKGEVQVTVTQANAKPSFTDMGNAQWALEAVNYLYQKGITTGTSATTFNPSGKITRGDFILMLYRAFHLSAGATDNFKDVPAGAYYAQAIAAAKALGIATGSGDGNFNPTANLTREDAMVFIQRTLSRTGQGVADAPASYLDKFPDGKRVSSYAQSAVAALVQVGFIKGDDSGRLNPKGSLTRAEMSVILYRVLTK